MYLLKWGYRVSALANARNTLITGSKARDSEIGLEAVSGSMSFSPCPTCCDLSCPGAVAACLISFSFFSIELLTVTHHVCFFHVILSSFALGIVFSLPSKQMLAA